MAPRANMPLHERIRAIGWLRTPLRKAFFTFLEKLAETDESRAIAVKTLRGLLKGQPSFLDASEASTPPYPGLGEPNRRELLDNQQREVFITARFRTGSTLLWNIFRNIEGITAYYEPFNERRWFDPATRGERMDGTHRNVHAYWWEYENLPELGEHYREDWIRHNLLMEASCWEPNMKRYVDLLIQKAPGRPVLQFNRIDFRLAWFRRNFPGAQIVHLYRHPRDQWCSTLIDLKGFPKDGKMAAFQPHDGFYLLTWARDLKYHFPFLDERNLEHPYELFYYLWKLSYLFGKTHAHYSLAFEDLLNDPEGNLTEMFQLLDVKGYDLERLKKLIVRPAESRWKEYAEEAWFARHETTCETTLAEFLEDVTDRVAV